MRVPEKRSEVYDMRITMRPMQYLLLSLVLLAMTGPASAATFNVTKLTDTSDGTCDIADCSLREAVIAANADAAADTIVLGAGEHILSITGTDEDASVTGDLDILNSVTIEGGGKAIINADSIDRVFHVINSTAVPMPVVTFSGLTLSGGYITTSGAGIFVSNGTVSVKNSLFSRNTSTNFGGGITVDSNSHATIVNCTFHGNSAGHGGGVDVGSGAAKIFNSTVHENTASYYGAGIRVFIVGNLYLENSTISGNVSSSVGGGIYVEDALSSNIINSTITGNSAGVGGGIYNSLNTIIGSSILSGNSAGTGPDCAGGLGSYGYNMIKDLTDCPFTSPATGDLPGIDPFLGPLADNGGPTLTHAPIRYSPAIDAGDPACAGTDQRGVLRPLEGGSGSTRCDIGALEYSIANISAAPAFLKMGKVPLGGYLEDTISVSNSGPYSLAIGNIGGSDPLEAPFSIVVDTCSAQVLAKGKTCNITVRFEPATYSATAIGIRGLVIVMLAMVMASGVSRKRKTLAALLIVAVMGVSLLAACGTDTETVHVKGDSYGSFSDTFNIPSNDPDAPNITVNVSGSF
jgi:CSLREA domain-containing protein